MAEKVEIDIPGIGLIEAKNAATETTLLEILDVLKGTQKDNNKNAKDQKNSLGKGAPPAPGGGGGGLDKFTQQAAGASKGLNLLTNAGKAAGIGMNVLGRGAGMAAGGIGKMAGGAVMAAGAAFTLGKVAMSAAEGMTNLIQEMANVGDSTQNAAATMRHIPVVGGLLAGVFGAVAAASENVVAAYQKSASIGATFGGSVQEMSRAAGGAGMTLDKFAGLIAANGESLMFLGGTTEAGAKQFANLAKDIQSSGVGSELQRLGYTTEQINGGMAKYINIIGRTGALQGMSTQQIVASSGAYLKELDALAKITGVSREQKEQEQAALMSDAKVRAAMAGLDADQQKQMMAYITSFPKEQQAAIADMIATGNTTTEEAIQLQSMLPGVAQRTMEFGRTLQAGGKINQDALNQAKNSAILEAQESVKRNKARGLYDEQAGKTFVGMANLASQKVDGYSQAIGEQANATSKANLAENLTKAKQRLAEFSNGFQMALANSGALDGLMTVFSSLANLLMSTVVPVFTNYIVPIIVNAVVPALQAVFAIATKIAFGLGTLLMPAIDAVSAALGPGSGLSGTVQFIDGILNAVFPPLAAIVRGTVMIFEGLMEGIGFLIGPIDRLFNSFNFLEGGTDTLTTIILTASDYLGTAFKALGFLLGGVIDVTGSVIRWFGDIVSKSEMVTGAFKFIGAAVDMIRTYFSPEGFKAIYASIKEFFTNGISDFIGSFKDSALSMFAGLLQLIGKIPGLGKLADAGKEMEKEIEDRKKARDDAAKVRKTEINQLHQAAVDSKVERDKKIVQQAAAVKQDSKSFAERKIHLEKVGGLNKQEEDEKKKKLEAEQGPTVDMSNPIQMLKTFSAQQKSAFTQEAKALDDKEKARSEMKMASDEYSKAMEARNKAMASGSAEEKKAAEARLAEAEKRQKAAQERQSKTQEAVDEAKKRMELAKAGKDPGPTKVAEGKPAEAGKPQSRAEGLYNPADAGKPAASEPARAQGTVPAINQDVQKNLELVKAALQKQGLNDPKYIAATLGNVMKETGGKSISENMDYSKTSNERIKKIFGSRAAGKTDQELDAIKKDPKQMGEMMYGSNTKMGQQMGNTEPGDGWKYRGRGFIQLTGKSNYAAASKAIYGDNRLVDNPDLVNDPAVAAEVSAWYMKKGQARMASGLGIDTKNMTQDQANLLATSQIAGGDIRKKGAIGQEISGKVDKFAGSAQIQAIAGAPGGPATATATPTPPVAGATAADAAKARADAAANDPRRSDRPATTAPATAPAVATTPAAGEVQAPQFAMQTLIKDGIVPTTIAFQDLVKKGIMPMLTGTQVKALEESKKGAIKPEDSLKPGEEIVKNLPNVAKSMADQLKTTGTLTGDDAIKAALEKNKARGMYDADAAKSYVGIAEEVKSSIGKAINPETGELYTPVDLKSQMAEPKMRGTYDNLAAAETPKLEMIAQKEKEAMEKIELERQQAANREQLRKEEIMAMNGPAGQNNPAGDAVDLNTALRELIAINKRTAELNEKQLSVQSSLSGDLFA